MKKFVKNIFVLILICIVPFTVLTNIFDRYFQSNMQNKEKAYWIFNKKNQKYDYAIVGSSRAFHMLNINKIDSNFNGCGINLGTEGTGYSENYLIFRKFFQNNNIVKKVFIQVDIFGFDPKKSFSYPFHDYLYMPFLKDSIVNQVFEDNIKPLKLFIWKYIPFAKYIEFSNYYPVISILSAQNMDLLNNYDTEKGSEILKDDYKKFDVIKHKDYAIDPVDYKYLVKLIEWCQINNIEVVLYTAPQLADLNKYPFIKQFIDIVDNEIIRISKKYNTSYFNFSKLNMCNDRKYFRDYTHLNEEGTNYFTQQFVDSLNSKMYFKN